MNWWNDWEGKEMGDDTEVSQNSPVAQSVKNLPEMQEMWVRSLGGEGPLEREMATHSSILAWRTPRTEEPGGLQSMGSQIGHDWGTNPPSKEGKDSSVVSVTDFPTINSLMAQTSGLTDIYSTNPSLLNSQRISFLLISLSLSNLWL